MDNISLATAEFAASARGFCSWCESAGSARTDAQAAAWLCRLYGQALALPQVGCENEEGLPDLPADELVRAEAGLAAFTGRFYREVFDPDPVLNEEPVVGDIGDDLLDTYKDLRAGLVLFERGDTQEALWHWSFLHRIHWGRHAVGAMMALHCFTISKDDELAP